MKNIKTYSLILLSAGFLTACETQEAGKAPYYFGNSVRQNIAAQTVNPGDPVSLLPPIHEGNRMILAQERYVTDMAETPEADTQNIMSGGGS